VLTINNLDLEKESTSRTKRSNFIFRISSRQLTRLTNAAA